ncbi:hypothetical protein QR685DRAFT_532849 [Neurospora intermedia]|uniref:Uncharacterized protein n=1 Tax=Neurospora intermedia TaxID=5142 RepID=A0ABR3D4F9_NEUIN
MLFHSVGLLIGYTHWLVGSGSGERIRRDGGIQRRFLGFPLRCPVSCRVAGVVALLFWCWFLFFLAPYSHLPFYHSFLFVLLHFVLIPGVQSFVFALTHHYHHL